MLDIRWLEDLIVLADTLNFTKASEIRNVTQSGLSRRIQSLEHWAGAPLFDRRKSPFELTDAGHKLLAVANDILGRLNGARRLIREDQDELSRSIRFAAPHILSMTFFPRWIPALQARLGSTRLSVTSDNLPGCVTALDDGAVDFVVCLADPAGAIFKAAGRPLSLDDCAHVTIDRETLIPLTAPDDDGGPLHRLDTGPRVSTSYLGYSRECSLGWAVDGLVASQTSLPRLNSLYENSLADALRTMALSGLGVAWLPLSTTHNDILRGKLIRAGESSLDIPLEIRIYRPPRKLPKRAEELWTRLMANPDDLFCAQAPKLEVLPLNRGANAAQ